MRLVAVALLLAAAFAATLPAAGQNDYYGADTGTSGYASLGALYAVPLGGAWDLSARIDSIYRAQEVAAIGPAFADHDRLAWHSSVLLKFEY